MEFHPSFQMTLVRADGDQKLRASGWTGVRLSGISLRSKKDQRRRARVPALHFFAPVFQRLLYYDHKLVG